jgi:hypothetical protein
LNVELEYDSRAINFRAPEIQPTNKAHKLYGLFMNNILSKKLITPKVISIALASTAFTIAALTYGKWETLTLLHAKEFDTAPSSASVAAYTSSPNTAPKFIKVIDYSDTSATVLWVIKSDGNYRTKIGVLTDGSTKDSHIQIDFIKEKNESGQLSWVIHDWYNCTPFEGRSSECSFPFYGAFPDLF